MQNNKIPIKALLYILLVVIVHILIFFLKMTINYRNPKKLQIINYNKTDKM